MRKSGKEKDDEASNEDAEEEPFPWRSMAAVSFVVFVECISMSSTIPYVPFLVAHYGKGRWDTATVGYVSGAVVSSFEIASVFFAPVWGSQSDIYGRKPIILFGLLGSCFYALGFGLSSNLYQALLFRFLWGVLNANMPVLNVATMELSNRKTEAKASAIYSGTMMAAVAVGPAIGGTLYGPCESGSVLENTSFGRSLSREHHPLCRYPALLPSLFVVVLALAAWLVTSYFMIETSTRKAELRPFGVLEMMRTLLVTPWKRIKAACCSGGGGGKNTNQQQQEEPKGLTTISDCFRDDKMRWIMIKRFCVSVVGSAELECLPLFCIAPVAQGGLGLLPKYLAVMLSTIGLCGFAVNWLFPVLERRLPRLTLWRYSVMVRIVAAFTIPFVTYVRDGTWASFSAGGTIIVLLLVVVPRTFAIRNTAGLLMLFTNALAPEKGRGKVMTVSGSVGALARTLSPIIFAPLFAWSISSPRHSSATSGVGVPKVHDDHGRDTHLFNSGHHFVFIIFALILCIPYLTASKLKELDVHRKKVPSLLKEEDSRLFDSLEDEDPLE